jgi:catalase-peroxidase
VAQRRHLPHRRRPRRRRLGQQRFAPLNSWPDNANLDKARRLLWPIKQKYGRKISWADLMILTGNVALESMGFKTFGFGGGREDVWEPEEDVYWGPETPGSATSATAATASSSQPARRRADGPHLREPRGARTATPIRWLAAAKDIRETFARMAMNDEETVALIAGGHTFGKTHGAAIPDPYVGPRARGRAASRSRARLEEQLRQRQGRDDTITSGLEARGRPPHKWDNDYFDNLFGYEWELTKSPAGAIQWKPEGRRGRGHRARRARPVEAPRADHADDRPRAALRPDLRAISKRFHENPDEFADAFAKAWFKLTHRDMGPRRSRYLGPGSPRAADLAGPAPAVGPPLIDDEGRSRR